MICVHKLSSLVFVRRARGGRVQMTYCLPDFAYPAKNFSRNGKKAWGGGFAVERAAWAFLTPVINVANFFQRGTSKGEEKEKGTPLLTRLQFYR
jgi:hypothetical protein